LNSRTNTLPVFFSVNSNTCGFLIVVGYFVDANLQQIIQTTKSFFQENSIYGKKK